MQLDYFSPDEFNRNGENWYDRCSPELLTKSDLLRHATGKIHISPHPDAIGRHGGDMTSQHNIDRWGEVRAIDVFPEYVDAPDVYNWVCDLVTHIIKGCGFRGYGIYTDTTFRGKPWVMVHLDVRESATMSQPTTWGRVNGEYVTLEEALADLRER